MQEISDSRAPALAVVIPVFDEEESLRPLHRELDASLGGIEGGVEMIFVDDGSGDGSAVVLRALAQKDPRVRVLTLDRHCGQSAALDAGFRAVRSPITATLDADLQNDPADLPGLLDQLSRADVVTGIRVERHDSRLKIVSSRIANAIRNRATGASISDIGCSLRVMRTCYLRRVKLYRGLHRFLPTLLELEGARVVEVPVSHRARRYGRSKYGIGDRLFESLLDLLAVCWMKRRSLRYRLR
jgi:glycosyltransferase involved in cell wall biosynthesis